MLDRKLTWHHDCVQGSRRDLKPHSASAQILVPKILNGSFCKTDHAGFSIQIGEKETKLWLIEDNQILWSNWNMMLDKTLCDRVAIDLFERHKKVLWISQFIHSCRKMSYTYRFSKFESWGFSHNFVSLYVTIMCSPVRYKLFPSYLSVLSIICQLNVWKKNSWLIAPWTNHA